jgi:hypothetical protein
MLDLVHKLREVTDWLLDQAHEELIEELKKEI